jgi:hypothetical protein
VGALSGVRPQRGYTTAQDDKQMDTLQYRPLDIEAIRKDSDLRDNTAIGFFG